LLVPLGDAHALNQALEALMRDPERRAELGKRAAESVRERFALTEVLDLWDQMLKRAMTSRNKGKA
jgi:glycosyltransferase involved in cell wall biosynthesis